MANQQQINSQSLNNSNPNNRLFYDSNWNNQNLINNNLKPINSFTYNNQQQPQQQQHQNQMINQDYNFNGNYHQQQQPMSQNHNYNSNYINQPSSLNDRNCTQSSNQMTLNMTNFDDSLTGFNHQGYANQTINPRCINPVNTPQAGEAQSVRKFSNQSGFGSSLDPHGVSQVSLPPVPSASSMINTVEDMTGTFSSQFAHEIIKSMDDGNLFSFEENLVCSFDIDQLDETTNDVRIILF